VNPDVARADLTDLHPDIDAAQDEEVNENHILWVVLGIIPEAARTTSL
jgi:hypothetical protein